MKREQKSRWLFKDLEMITYFRSYSVFFRFFSLILLLVIVLIVSFSVYISRVIEGNSREKQDQSNQQMLVRTANQMDNSLFFLEQILNVAGNNKYVVDAAVRPGLNFDERNQDVVAFLREIPRNNAFINQVWLYEGTDQTIFSSNGSVARLTDYQQKTDLREILEQVEQEKNAVIVRNTGKNRSMIFSGEGNLYVVFESLLSKDGPFLSKLIAEINGEYLFRENMEEISSSQCGLTICDGVGETLFSNAESLNVNQDKALLYTSDYVGWIYRLYPGRYVGGNWLLYLKQILPFLVAATLGSLLIALVVTEKIYSPISEMTKQLWQNRETGMYSMIKEHKVSEIGFLYQTYSKALQDKEKADYLIMEIRPDLEQKLFWSLLNGAEYSESYLAQRLRDIRSKFCVQANYQVMLLHFPDLDETEDMASYLSIREIEQKITGLFPEEQGQMLYMQRDDTGIVILQYSQEYSAAKIRTADQYFEERIQKFLSSRGVDVIVAYGKVYLNLKDLSLSYEEARDRLRRQIYFQNDGIEEDEKLVFTDTVQKYFALQLNQLGDLLSKNDMAAGEEQLKKILQEFRERDVDLTFCKYYYEQLLDTLIEKSLQFYVEQDSFATKDYQEIYKDLQASRDKMELADYVEPVILRQFDFIKNQALRKQNRIVTKAKEYIDENYDKGDLSIQLIAESIGINASYLSNLFATYTGENLVSYINEYRINVAIHLLLNTTISIKEIGYKTGFNTAQNFNRVFKRVTGTTPSKYREQNPE